MHHLHGPDDVAPGAIRKRLGADSRGARSAPTGLARLRDGGRIGVVGGGRLFDAPPAGAPRAAGRCPSARETSRVSEFAGNRLGGQVAPGPAPGWRAGRFFRGPRHATSRRDSPGAGGRCSFEASMAFGTGHIAHPGCLLAIEPLPPPAAEPKRIHDSAAETAVLAMAAAHVLWPGAEQWWPPTSEPGRGGRCPANRRPTAFRPASPARGRPGSITLEVAGLAPFDLCPGKYPEGAPALPRSRLRR